MEKLEKKNENNKKIAKSEATYGQEKPRVILHSDLNNFFASVECALAPELKGKPMAVCGSQELRHGIVLAKSEEAKKYGIKTAMTVVEAKRLCPMLITVPPRHEKYVYYSQKARKIYLDYTDLVEPFGIDEAWLNVTNSCLFGSGEKIADEIRARMKSELGLTCSVGVSYNKVFAKLGSDLKKPDGTTVISRENRIKTVWRLPVENLLYVGKSTLERLNKYNIYTIGDLAATDEAFLIEKFGKWGETLSKYARGDDDSPVKKYGEEEDAKSIGNSVTPYRDLKTLDDVKNVLAYLCESVSERALRYGAGKARTVTLSVRDNALVWLTRQTKLPYPSLLSGDIFSASVALFKKHYDFRRPVRSIGVTVSDFMSEGEGEQLAIGQDVSKYEKRLELEKNVNALRKKYGKNSVRRGITLSDEAFGLEAEQNKEVSALSKEAEKSV